MWNLFRTNSQSTSPSNQCDGTATRKRRTSKQSDVTKAKRDALARGLEQLECRNLLSADGVGLYQPDVSLFQLKDSLSPGAADHYVAYGPSGSAGWVPLTGDWNGDGIDTIGLYQPDVSLFHLKDTLSSGASDHYFAFGPGGNAGWIPLAGDWDGDGTDTIGFYDPADSLFHLKNSFTPGASDQYFAFGPGGNAGWTPLVGDWDGDGVDTIGLYQPSNSLFHLKDSFTPGASDHYFAFGPGGNAGWDPLSGDWNGDGVDTIGLHDPSFNHFHLKDSFTPGFSDHFFTFGPGGNVGWTPLTGDWTNANGGGGPTAEDEELTLDENESSEGDVTPSDGIGGDPLGGDEVDVIRINGAAFTSGNPITLPSGALVTMDVDGSFTYDTNGQFDSLSLGETTTDSFTYTIDDLQGFPDSTDTATVKLNINGVNDRPVAQDDSVSTDEESVITGGDLFADNGSGADHDPDGNDSFSITQVNGTGFTPGTQMTLQSGALLTVNSNGTFSYDPNGVFNSLSLGQSVTDSFTYTVDDGRGQSNSTDSATVSLTIDGVNDRPVAQDDAGVTDEDTVLVASSLLSDHGSGNDSDPDGGDSIFVSHINGSLYSVGQPIQLPSGALFTMNANGTFSYDPNGQFESLGVGQSASDSLTYTLNDGRGQSNSTDVATLSLTINGRNDSPIAQTDSVSTNEDTALTGANLLSDNGSGSDFDPDNGDSFSLTKINGAALSPGATLTLASGALLTVNANGTFDYDPNGQFESLSLGQTGSDSFTYAIDDGRGLSNSEGVGTVNLTIHGRNDQSTAQDDSATTDEDTILVGGNLLSDNGSGADSDPDSGDTLTVTRINGATFSAGNAFALPSGALLTMNSNGTFSYNPNGQFNALAVGQNASDSFTYTIDDGRGQPNSTDSATVSLTINGRNDSPIALIDAVFTDEDSELLGANLFADNGSGADFDPDSGDTFGLTQINGANFTPGSQITLPSGALLTVNNDGSFDYDPNSQFESLSVGENGADSFTYTIADNQGLPNSATTGTVNVTISGRNDVSVAQDDTGTTDEDTVLSGVNLLSDNGSGADSDPDSNDTLTVTKINGVGFTFGSPITLPSGATLTISSNGQFSYDPNGQFESLAVGQSSSDGFSYTIDDGQGLPNSTSNATVSLTINGRNDSPIAQADAVSTDEDTKLSNGNLFSDNGSGADSDPDSGDLFSVTQINGVSFTPGSELTLPSGALLEVNSDGTFDYDPNGQFESLGVGETGSDSFSYTIDDGRGQPNSAKTATVSVTINGQNDLPVAQNDAFTTETDTLVSGNLLADNGNGVDSDPDANDTVFTVVQINGSAFSAGTPFLLPSGATLTVDSDGDFTYLPANGVTGVDTFSYTINDGHSGLASGVVTITTNAASS